MAKLGYFQGFHFSSLVLKSHNWYKYGFYLSNQLKIEMLFKGFHTGSVTFWTNLWSQFGSKIAKETNFMPA